MNHHRRVPLDLDAYERRVRKRCFICGLVAGDPEDRHHVVYEDDRAIAFLSRYPSVYGHTLVAPREHREHVTADFSLKQYLALQRVAHRVGEAVQSVVPTERLYVLSLGSQQGNRHVHWHLVPLPPGVPYREQQIEVLRAERGVLEIADEEVRELAGRIRAALGRT